MFPHFQRPASPFTPASYLADALTAAVTPDDISRANSQSTKMLLAISATGRHVYPGTVSSAEVARRRAANRRARHARRAHRLRAGR